MNRPSSNMPPMVESRAALARDPRVDGNDSHDHSSISSAMLLTLAGFASLSLGDAVIKSAAGLWPSTGVAALRFTLGAVLLGLLLLVRSGPSAFFLPMPKYQIARGAMLATATLAFFTSIFLMPLADATAILFISPALTALLSAWLLKERVAPHIWVASVIAFIGVVLILRPNIANFGPTAALPLIAALAMSGVMMLNRKVAGSGGVLLMQFLLACFTAPFLILATIAAHYASIEGFTITAPPPQWVWIVCVVVACTSSVSHMLIYLGTTRASAAVVAPMVYVQLLVALLVGVFFYQDYPDLQAMGGAVLIIASGLYLWQRSRAA
ncbi:DMT family transporter [Alterisphingorhabdus coralli]|uniref:DMT family transporter n=1 Tax=Alterisphingorhabdus coralli TaxID=3071408 RepID=A0AA97I0G5_9SPHN|nr:DMT family transporter [Parasphingorhabdus sp. SCSIO 66989]WOE74175.1 DMT family transporter [Parasphingorhabdus sp. SCSIO 66989]